MVGTEKRQKTAIIYVRVKPEVKAMLDGQAEAQGRSLANFTWRRSPGSIASRSSSDSQSRCNEDQVVNLEIKAGKQEEG